MNESTNPIFKNISFDDSYQSSVGKATYAGISAKTLICLLLTVLSGIASISFLPVNVLNIALIVAPIVGFISVMVGSRNPNAAMASSIIYSIAQGVTLGVLTLICEAAYPGIAIAAILATVTVFGVSLFFFATGLVKASGKLRKFVLLSLISMMVISIITLIGSLFGNYQIADFFYGNGLMALMLSVFTVLIASFMLIIDFDEAAGIVESGADKKYEWMSTLGLMVSIIYLYYQILHLLLIIFSRD